MDQNIEDILSGDNPPKDLDKAPKSESKNMGYRIINMLREYRNKPMNAYSREQLCIHSIVAAI